MWEGRGGEDVGSLRVSCVQVSAIDSSHYQLEETVTVWSDYLGQHLHPRSLLLLPGYHHQESVFPLLSLLY